MYLMYTERLDIDLPYTIDNPNGKKKLTMLHLRFFFLFKYDQSIRYTDQSTNQWTGVTHDMTSMGLERSI